MTPLHKATTYSLHRYLLLYWGICLELIHLQQTVVILDLPTITVHTDQTTRVDVNYNANSIGLVLSINPFHFIAESKLHPDLLGYGGTIRRWRSLVVSLGDATGALTSTPTRKVSSTSAGRHHRIIRRAWHVAVNNREDFTLFLNSMMNSIRSGMKMTSSRRHKKSNVNFAISISNISIEHYNRNKERRIA